MLIYFRHGHDDEADSTYEHDARLTDKGIDKCRKYALRLCAKYGIPNAIYCSPFARARETAKFMAVSIYGRYKVKVRLVIDPMLGRFFTSDQRGAPDIRPGTLKYDPIIDNSDKELMRRINTHIKKMQHKGYIHHKVIWCVSHGVIIKKLVRELGHEAPEHVEFLQKFVIKG